MFLSRVFIIQFLSEEAYGQISYIWNTCIVIGTILLFGRGQEALITIPHLNKKDKKTKAVSYLQHALIFYVLFVISLVLMVIYRSNIVFFEWSSAICIGILYMIFYIPIFISIGYQDYKSILFFNSILYVGLNFLILVFRFIFELSPFLVILAYILAFLFSSFIGIMYIAVKNQIKARELIRNPFLTKEGSKNWSKDRLQLFLCDIIGVSYSFITLSIMKMVNITYEEIAYMSVAFLYSSLLMVVPQRVIQAIGPRLVKEYNETKLEKGISSNPKYTISYQLGLKSIVLFSGILILITGIVSYYFTKSVFGISYAENLHPTLIIFMISIIFKSINFYNYVTIRNTRRISQFLYIHIVFAILQSVFISVFSIYLGLQGILFSFVIIELLHFIIIIVLLNKKVSVCNIKFVIKTITPLFFVIFVFIIIYFNSYLIETFSAVSIVLIVGTILFFFLSLLSGVIKKEELGVIIEKIMSKFGINNRN